MKKNLEISFICTFLAAELAIFIFVFACPEYSKVSYAATCLAFAFAFVFVKKDARVILTIVALFFTCVSDWFLVLRAPFDQSTAMTTFLVVQLCYAARLNIEILNKKLKIFDICLHAVLSALMIVVTKLVLGANFDYLSAVSIAYYTNIILNVIVSMIKFKKSPLLAIGLLLFVFCDTIVGLNTAIGTYIDVPANSIWYMLSHTPFDLAKVFYMPSQALISLSVKDCK